MPSNKAQTKVHKEFKHAGKIAAKKDNDGANG